jgi:hypothetical protein
VEPNFISQRRLIVAHRTRRPGHLIDRSLATGLDELRCAAEEAAAARARSRGSKTSWITGAGLALRQRQVAQGSLSARRRAA